MKKLWKWGPVLGSLFLGTFCAHGQWMLSKEQMIAYTAKNPYDRFPDGRPKVPDNLLEQVKSLVIEESWGAVRSGCSTGGGRGGGGRGGANAGAANAASAAPGCFPNQFSGDWKILNPGKKLVGRAFTVQFMPTRPDVADAMQAEAEKKGLGRLRNQTVIDMLQPNDVIVVDLFGKIDGGTFVGDKLAYYIWKTTGTGMVVDGAMFWLGKIIPTGMPAYYRGTAPDALSNVMLTGNARRRGPGRGGRSAVHTAAPWYRLRSTPRRAPSRETSGSSRRWICASTSPASFTDGRPIRPCRRNWTNISRRTNLRSNSERKSATRGLAG